MGCSDPLGQKIFLCSWAAEAFALKAIPPTPSILQSIFIPISPENGNQVTIDSEFQQSIVFRA
jgi:hypothetical protein